MVEVTLAIGIFGFAFTAVVGLIPVGLVTFRHAMDATIGAQICQRVINDAQQTDFDVLTTGSNATALASGTAAANGTPIALPLRYFDDEGNALDVSNKGQAIYEVNTVVTPVTVMPSNAAYASLATVAVQIVNNPGHQEPKTNSSTKVWADPAFAISSYSGFVSRNK